MARTYRFCPVRRRRVAERDTWSHGTTEFMRFGDRVKAVDEFRGNPRWHKRYASRLQRLADKVVIQAELQQLRDDLFLDLVELAEIDRMFFDMEL